MTACAYCGGKIKRGESVVHETCSEHDADDAALLALLELQASWRRVRDMLVIGAASQWRPGTSYPGPGESAAERRERARADQLRRARYVEEAMLVADAVYPGGRS